MRMLLLELRPAALADVPMHDLLRHLADAITAREQLETSVTLAAEVNLPAEEKTAFYRIAQEALNNVVKHARATRVDIQLATEAEQVMLCIQDNGAGFAPGSGAAGHLGLRIMRERAEAIGAHLEIASEPGQGTRICLRRRPGDVES
jgi:signal transduction histidine kinase